MQRTPRSSASVIRRLCLVTGTVLVLVHGSAGCALFPSQDPPPRPVEQARERQRPLAGEALDQRRASLERAWRDMIHLHSTLRTLVERHDRSGTSILDDFLRRYLSEYLAGLLEDQWQSNHPELMALDANLRLIEATLWAEMQYPRRMQKTLDEIQARYAGRGTLLVQYPVGTQRPLHEAVEQIRGGAWDRSLLSDCEKADSLTACLDATL